MPRPLAERQLGEVAWVYRARTPSPPTLGSHARRTVSPVRMASPRRAVSPIAQGSPSPRPKAVSDTAAVATWSSVAGGSPPPKAVSDAAATATWSAVAGGSLMTARASSASTGSLKTAGSSSTLQPQPQSQLPVQQVQAPQTLSAREWKRRCAHHVELAQRALAGVSQRAPQRASGGSEVSAAMTDPAAAVAAATAALQGAADALDIVAMQGATPPSLGSAGREVLDVGGFTSSAAAPMPRFDLAEVASALPLPPMPPEWSSPSLSVESTPPPVLLQQAARQKEPAGDTGATADLSSGHKSGATAGTGAMRSPALSGVGSEATLGTPIQLTQPGTPATPLQPMQPGTPVLLARACVCEETASAFLAADGESCQVTEPVSREEVGQAVADDTMGSSATASATATAGQARETYSPRGRGAVTKQRRSGPDGGTTRAPAGRATSKVATGGSKAGGPATARSSQRGASIGVGPSTGGATGGSASGSVSARNRRPKASAGDSTRRGDGHESARRSDGKDTSNRPGKVNRSKSPTPADAPASAGGHLLGIVSRLVDAENATLCDASGARSKKPRSSPDADQGWQKVDVTMDPEEEILSESTLTCANWQDLSETRALQADVEKGSGKVLQLLREAEQDRDHYKHAYSEVQQKLQEAVEALAKSERRQRDLERERDVLSSRLDDASTEQKELSSKQNELLQRAVQAEECLHIAESARSRERRSLLQAERRLREQGHLRQPSGSPAPTPRNDAAEGHLLSASPAVDKTSLTGIAASPFQTSTAAGPSVMMSPSVLNMSAMNTSALNVSLVLAPPHTRPRVLVTGATGLLGRQVMKALDAAWDVRGLGLSRAQPPVVACNLLGNGSAVRQIEAFQPHVVIHLAAARRPKVESMPLDSAEVGEEFLATAMTSNATASTKRILLDGFRRGYEAVKNEDAQRAERSEAQQLNVEVTGSIAAACERHGAWLVFLSTDQVFDGASPPYGVDAESKPLSEYGRQKLQAEKLVLASSPRAAVLRVPQLYGPAEFLEECFVTSLYADALRGVQKIDDWQLHYPTWTGDVARILRCMVDLHCSGTVLRGVFHWQSNEQFTKFEVLRAVAEVAEVDVSNVVPITSKPADIELPQNTQLDCSRLEDLLPNSAAYRTPLRQGLEICLAPFLNHGACPSSSPRPPS